MDTRRSSRVLIDFPHDSAPVPLKFVVLAGAEQVEYDATETKFSELVLHRVLILFFLSAYRLNCHFLQSLRTFGLHFRRPH